MNLPTTLNDAVLWECWEWVGLRGSGFPVALVERFQAPRIIAAIDQLLELESRTGTEDEKAIQILLALRTKSQIQHVRSSLTRTLKRMNARKPIHTIDPELDEPYRHVIAAYNSRHELIERVKREIGHLLTDYRANMMVQCKSLSQDERIREVLIWQNRRLACQLSQMLERNQITERQARRLRILLFSLLQRLCMKNDTISFFGPVGWAHLTTDAQALTMDVENEPLALRKVYFETWAIDTVGQVLAREQDLQIWACPRRQPFLLVEKQQLILPFASPVPLSALDAAVLSACDGSKNAKTIAEHLVQQRKNGIDSEDQVYAALRKLVKARRIHWTFDVATEEIYPECDLQRQFLAIHNDEARRRALQPLERLIHAKEGIEASRNRAGELDQAVSLLEMTFEEVTGIPATRNPGETYGARMLVYEDCLRNGKVQLGKAFLQDAIRPLEIILTGSRWLLMEIETYYFRLFQNAYKELTRRTQNRFLNFAEFWLWINPFFFQDFTQLEQTVIHEFQQRWLDVLQPSLTERHQTYRSHEIAVRVRQAFIPTTTHQRIQRVRYHSPDVLIAAASEQAIQQGEYLLVLGEMHTGINALDTPVFLAQHPQPEQLHAALDRDYPHPRIVPVMSKNFEATVRAHYALCRPQDYRLILSGDAVVRTDHQLPLSSLLVEMTDTGLSVCDRAHRLRFDIADVFAELIGLVASRYFRMFPETSHTPRITIDQLVAYRESWRFQITDIPCRNLTDPVEEMTTLRRWQKAQDLPDAMFVRFPTEKKPIFIDFTSPVALEVLLKHIQGIRDQAQTDPEAGQSIVFSEMLPLPEQCWLVDAQGNHYTSELRFVITERVAR